MSSLATADVVVAAAAVEVKSYLSDELLYELYSFWEQIVVICLADIATKKFQSPSDLLAEQYVHKLLSKLLYCDYVVKIKNGEVYIYVSEYDKWWVIGKWWENVQALEQQLWWIRINIRSLSDLSEDEDHKVHTTSWNHLLIKKESSRSKNNRESHRKSNRK